MPRPLAGPRNDAQGAGRGATGVPAEAPPLCECLTAGRGALFPAARKNFKKISKCRKRGTGARGERIAAAPCGASQ